MIAWSILNLALAHKQWSVSGQVSNSLILVNLFQVGLVNESLEGLGLVEASPLACLGCNSGLLVRQLDVEISLRQVRL